MTVRTIDQLKDYFKTDDVPTQDQFGDVFDTMFAGAAPPVGTTAGTVAAGDHTHAIADVSGLASALTAMSAVAAFDTVALMIADTAVYGSDRVAGQVIVAEGYRYIIAASGASDHHLTTAGGIKLYVQRTGAGFETKAFGARHDGQRTDIANGNTMTGSNDTAAIQACLNAAKRAAGSDMHLQRIGRGELVTISPGIALVNNLDLYAARVHINGWGAALASYAAQGSGDNYLLTVRGDQHAEGVEAGHAFGNQINGLSFYGRGHAYVRGLHMHATSHSHLRGLHFAGFLGVNGQALKITEGFDFRASDTYIQLSGRDNGNAADSIPAMHIVSGAFDSSNQLTFDKLTMEANRGGDLLITRPNATYPSGQINFRSSKWESGPASGTKIYYGVWSPQSIFNTISFSDRCFVGGYHRDGGWLEIETGSTGRVLISEDNEFGAKTSQAPAGEERPTIILSGAGSAKVGGCLSDLRVDYVPWIDVSDMTNPLAVEYGNIVTNAGKKLGVRVIGRGDLEYRVETDQGLLRHSFKLAANAVGRFMPRGDFGVLEVITNDRPTECGRYVVRADGTQSIAAQIAGSAIEVGTGTLTDGDTGTTAARLHIRVGTDGSIYVQNRESFGIVTYLSFYPTEGY